MSINMLTAQRIIDYKKPYHTNKGNTYQAVPLFDKNGRLHGHAIYQKTNLFDNEKPMFILYMPLIKPDRNK